MGSLGGQNFNNKRLKGYSGIGSQNLQNLLYRKGQDFREPSGTPPSKLYGSIPRVIETQVYTLRKETKWQQMKKKKAE